MCDIKADDTQRCKCKVDVIYDVLGTCQGRRNTRRMYFEDSDEVKRNLLMMKTTSELEMVGVRRQRTGNDDGNNDIVKKAMLPATRRAAG